MWLDRHVWRENWTSFIRSALHYESDDIKRTVSSQSTLFSDHQSTITTYRTTTKSSSFKTTTSATHNNASDVAALKATDGDVE